ncbi:MAG: hypothetical protein KY432_00210 [Acidobacteria bacterium]|nr:hypothetical protein [Acidobacteriota bacterium]
MAYLVGSAYLEWLRAREGTDSLRNVWARLSARRTRSFDEAFEGVFGESPAALYARFRAELTHQALELEKSLEPIREGDLWQDLSWQSGVPAVSADGTQIAIVLRGREQPSRLVVWSTDPDEKGLEKWEEEVRKLLEKDPEDVPPVRRKPLRREPQHELTAGNGADMLTPRWLPDGSILFVRYEPDARGFLHPDLFRWRPGSGEADRLTHGADLREPTPVDSNRIVAVRRRHGKSGLVLHDFVTGEERELAEPSLHTIYGWPRADRVGQRVAFSRHAEGRWRLAILDLGAGTVRDLELPPGATTVAWPEWSVDGTSIYATVGVGGLLDIWRFDAEGATSPTPVTRSFGAAMAPSTGGEGARLFFLGMDADGLDLRVLEPPAGTALEPIGTDIAALVPFARPPLREIEPLSIAEIGPSRPYGIGSMEPRWLFGGGRTPSEQTWEVGVRGGDVLGRLDSMIVGAISNGGYQGGSARAIWRGWPIEVKAHLFGFERERSDSPVALPPTAGAPDEERWGGEVIAGWSRAWRDGRLGLEGGTLIDRISYSGSDRMEVNREIAFLTIEAARRLPLHPWMFGGSADLSVLLSEDDGEAWRGWTGEVGILAGLEDHRATGWYRRGELDQIDPLVISFVAGGAPSSLTPTFDHLVRVWSPGLVEGMVSGSHYEGWRAEIETELLPVVPFYEAHRAGDALEGGWTDLAGARLDLKLDPFPLLKLPGVTLSLGGAYILAGPRADETEWWLTTRWRLD